MPHSRAPCVDFFSTKKTQSGFVLFELNQLYCSFNYTVHLNVFSVRDVLFSYITVAFLHAPLSEDTLSLHFSKCYVFVSFHSA